MITGLSDQDDPDHAGEENEVARVNGTQVVGPATTIQVGPGDRVSAQVYAYYTATSDNSNTVTTAALIGALSSAYQATTGFAEASAVFTQDQSSILAEASGGSQGDQIPAAYLNYLYFGEDHTFVRGGYTSIAEGANMHQLMELNNLSAFEQPGYVMVYVSYEGVEHYVDFDDLTVTHTESAVVQADDYYPGGLVFNSYARLSETPNKYLYQGKELQDDLDLNLTHFEGRFYDAIIWRTPTMDPNAEEYAHLSPYSWAGNNPISNVDPDGRDWYKYTDDDGNESVVWREGNDQTIDVDGNSYQNIGAAYATTLEDGSVAIYHQNEVFAILESDQSVGPETQALVGALQDPDGQHNFDTMTPQWEMLFFSAETALMISGGASQGKSKKSRNRKGLKRNSTQPRGENAQLNEQQKQNLKRFIKKAPANSKSPQIRRLGNGNVQISIESPGKVAGSKAIYVKEVDGTGTTVKMYKVTRDPSGNMVHSKNKLK